jgi:hypothetical protein
MLSRGEYGLEIRGPRIVPERAKFDQRHVQCVKPPSSAWLTVGQRFRRLETLVSGCSELGRVAFLNREMGIVVLPTGGGDFGHSFLLE